MLLISCPDQQGIVAAVTKFLSGHSGNILHLDQHVDTEENIFFMRVEWELAGFTIRKEDAGEAFRPVAESFAMEWALYFTEERPRAAVLVSKMSHCLYEVLARHQGGEWRVEIPLIVSNHPDVEPIATQFGIPFHVLPVTAETRAPQEEMLRALLAEHQVDFVILARYMQILTGAFIRRYPNRIINIHHSFLPAFPGARPYHSAYARGVKIIGATSHYVTEELDAGPIIQQDIIRVSHKDAVPDLVRKGKDLEKIVLARAVRLHLERRILVYNNKTVVFD